MEIDLHKLLEPKIIVRGHLISVEYKGLHAVCFRCGTYGHKMEGCVDPFPVEASQEPKDNQVNVAKPLDVSKELAIISNDVSSTSAPIGDAGEGSKYGPWMLVKCSNNRRPRNQNALGAFKGLATNPLKPPTQEKVQGQGNRLRFSALGNQQPIIDPHMNSSTSQAPHLQEGISVQSIQKAMLTPSQ